MKESREEAQSKAPWSYDGERGPERWHGLYPSIGEMQSPIDIIGAVVGELAEIDFSYVEEPLLLYRENYTVKAGPLGQSFLTLDGIKFQLEELHFHSPSEHLLESRRYALEAHLVHIGVNGELMALAVFIVEGSSRKDFNPLIESFERFALTKEQTESLLIDPFDFIPKNQAYYTYHGSYTCPPCTEGVRWLVFRDPFELPGSEIERLRRVVGNNCRPVQSLNGRVIESSF